jgi:hypothetical protein
MKKGWEGTRKVIRGLWLAAVLGLLLAAAATWAQKPATEEAHGLHTPGKASAERKAILNALRARVKADVIFVVELLNVHGEWAWVHVKPQSADGKNRYDDTWALLHEKDGRWEVAELPCTRKDSRDCIGAAGFYQRLQAMFSNAPPDIFTEARARELAETPAGVEVVRANYGSGPDDLGHCIPQEALPEGPKSFALGSKDEIYVLDQINSRVQVFKDKTRIRTIPIPDNWDSDFEDIALTKDGKIVLLDTSLKKKVHLLDARGTVLKELPLAGKYIPDSGKGSDLAVFGVYCREDGVWDGIWVEVPDRSVRIADLAGNPDPNRVSVMGRFTYDGKRLMKAVRLGEVTAVVQISKENPAQWTEFRVLFDMYIGGLDGPYTDEGGNIFLGVLLENDGTFANVMVILDPAGREKRRINMFVPYRVEQVWRALRVSPDGKIYQLALDDQGVVVRRYDP